MAAQQNNPKLTITLTDTRPITIVKDDWPVLASAKESAHDGQVYSQSNERRTWRLTVRQHAGGRAVVYGVYDYDTNWQGRRDVNERAGELVSVGGDVIAAINRVADMIADRIDGDDADTMRRMARECIADLPPVEL